MKRSKIDMDMPIGKLTAVKDISPSPAELARTEKTVKVTLRLSHKSMEFFKAYARKHHTKYQKMIRRLVDSYAEKHALAQ